jgi:regulator of replication initiation timing
MSLDNNRNNILMDNNSLKNEIVTLNKEIRGIKEEMNKMIETNNKMAYELSRIMPYLKNFSEDVSHDLHYIKYK